MNDNTSKNKSDSKKKLHEIAKEFEKAKTPKEELKVFLKHIDLKRSMEVAKAKMLKSFIEENPDILKAQLTDEQKQDLIEYNTYFIKCIKEGEIPAYGKREYFNLGILKKDILFRLNKPTIIKSQLIENEIKTVKDYIQYNDNNIFQNSLNRFFSGKEINFAVKLEPKDLFEILRAETIALYLVFLENLEIRSSKQKKSNEKKYLKLPELFEDTSKLDEIDKKLLQKKYIKSRSDGTFFWIGNPLKAKGNLLRLVALAIILKEEYFRIKCSDKQLCIAIRTYYKSEINCQNFKDSQQGAALKYMDEFNFF